MAILSCLVYSLFLGRNILKLHRFELQKPLFHHKSFFATLFFWNNSNDHSSYSEQAEVKKTTYAIKMPTLYTFFFFHFQESCLVLWTELTSFLNIVIPSKNTIWLSIAFGVRNDHSFRFWKKKTNQFYSKYIKIIYETMIIAELLWSLSSIKRFVNETQVWLEKACNSTGRILKLLSCKMITFKWFC